MKNLNGEYNSTHHFIEAQGLEKEAEQLFGEGWEAEDDVEQIKDLIDNLGGLYNFYIVSINEYKKQDDIIVEYSEEQEEIAKLKQRLEVLSGLSKKLVDAINLNLGDLYAPDLNSAVDCAVLFPTTLKEEDAPDIKFTGFNNQLTDLEDMLDELNK